MREDPYYRLFVGGLVGSAAAVVAGLAGVVWWPLWPAAGAALLISSVTVFAACALEERRLRRVKKGDHP